MAQAEFMEFMCIRTPQSVICTETLDIMCANILGFLTTLLRPTSNNQQ